MKRFNKAMLKINEADEQVIMMTFQAGLNDPNLVFSLGRTPLTSMMDLLFKALKYMNGEDALTTKGLMGKRKKTTGKKKTHQQLEILKPTTKNTQVKSTQYKQLEILKPRYAIQRDPHNNHTPRTQQPTHEPSGGVEVREEEHQPFWH